MTWNDYNSYLISLTCCSELKYTVITIMIFVLINKHVVVVTVEFVHVHFKSKNNHC